MKKITSLLLILALFLSLGFGSGQLLSFNEDNYVYAIGAASFKDVKSDYWGYSYIDFAAQSGIISGYPELNGTYTFLPENSVSREEAMSMLYRALSAAGKLKSQEDFSAQYKELFATHGIADWAKKFVAYGLKYGLISTDELADFTDDNGNGIQAPREQIARWTATAVDKGLAPAYSLSYVDKDSISSQNIPYVDLLYRQGIMRGDDTSMFHPKSGIRRVEFAVICNKVFEVSEAAGYRVDNELQSYRGTIVSVDTINQRIMMTQSDGTSRMIQVNPKTRIVLDGKLEYNGLSNIKSGSSAVLAWGAFGGMGVEKTSSLDEGMQIHILTKVQTRVGLLSDVEEMDRNTSLLTIKNSEGDSAYYISDKDTQKVNPIQKGSEVTFIADGVKIIEIK